VVEQDFGIWNLNERAKAFYEAARKGRPSAVEQAQSSRPIRCGHDRSRKAEGARSERAPLMYKDKIIAAARVVVKNSAGETYGDSSLVPDYNLTALRAAIQAYDDFRATLNSTPITGGG
jgi:hypothetical protein